MSLVEKYNLDIRNYKIANHPAVTESYIHKKLIKEIIHLKNTYKNKLNSNNLKFRSFSIFIGATGAVVEALERGFKVIHITEYPNLDSYSEYFWNNIINKSLMKNLNLYTLKKRSHSIMFGNKPKNLDIYFQDKIN